MTTGNLNSNIRICLTKTPCILKHPCTGAWMLRQRTSTKAASHCPTRGKRASKDSDLISAVLDNQNPLNHGQTKAPLSTIIVARGSTFVARRNFPFKKTRKKNMYAL
uniref:Uncharacterized protein n=3 Tax=Oryza TaxID=4527 RepID=Q8LNM0_ORYSJ|nr:hypothetical protein [Oryza sativa Japonica Group]AAP54834.1 hypothetical protein LOC_Os10g39370 [Oryza sativa Japonica Group]